jgi:hypothetical protein
MNDDLDLLASAYLDGDLDDAARADAEANPALVARVAELRAVREAVASVEGVAPAAAGTREAVLASALAAYDELQNGHERVAAAAGPVAPVAPLAPRRRRSTRWLGAVAAATVVAAGIGVVVASVANQDDDEEAGISEAAVVGTDAPADERLEASSAQATIAGDAAPEVAAGGAGTDAPAAATPSTTTAGAAEATQPEVFSGDATLAAPAPLVVGESNLAAYVEQARRGAADDAVEAVLACRDERFADVVGTIDYSADPSSEVVHAVVVVDATGTTAYAVDAPNCDVVAAVEVDG